MPGYVIHLAVAKEFMNHHNITDVDQFLNGCIMPDLLEKPKSHFGENTSNPNLDQYLDNQFNNDDYSRGYFLHLLTDYLFYNKFLDSDWSPEIYNEYDKLNRTLIEKYGINIPDEIKDVVQFQEGNPKILDFESICDFIDTIGRISIDQAIETRRYEELYESAKAEVENERQKSMNVETFLDYNQILKVLFEINPEGINYAYECAAKDKRLGEIIINNLNEISRLEETEDPNTFRLAINDTIFINISKDGKVESVNKLTAFETRSLAQSQLNKIPFSREENVDFVPKTDLHTHFAGALRTETLIKIGKEHNIGYPAKKLKDMGIDISQYEVDEKGNINVNNISDIDIEVLESFLRIPIETQETYRRMQQVYALRKPFTKDKELFPEFLRELAADYKENGVEYAELSMTNFMTEPEYMQMAEDCLPDIEKETGVKLRFLAAIGRRADKEWNQDEIDRMQVVARSPYIVGMDVMGFELNSTKTFAEELQRMAQYAMKEDPEFSIRVHAGENPVFEKNVRDALEIIYNEHAKLEEETGEKYPMPRVRIGHGLYGVTPEVLDLAKKMNAIIEFNMSSNLALNNIDSIAQVPIKQYLDSGVKVVLATDGHGTYSTTTKQEVLLAKAAGLLPEDFEKIKETEAEVLEKAKIREEKHPKIDDVPGLYSQIVYSTEDGNPHFTKEVEEKYRVQKKEALKTLGEKITAIGAISDEDEIERVTEGKVPIIITGASKNSWDNILPEDQKNISVLMQVLADKLDPDKAYIITGGTNIGVEKTMHEAVNRRNTKDENKMVVLGTFTMQAMNHDFSGLEKDTITHGTILENEGKVANDWQELPDTQLGYAGERNGSVIAIGGGNIVANMIQRAHNLGNIDLHIMDGPYGASTNKSRSLEGNGYSFKTIEELVQRLYSRNSNMFVKDFSLDNIESYISKAVEEIGEQNKENNPANFGLGAIADIDSKVTFKDREKAQEDLKKAVKETENTKEGETRDDS